MPVPTLHPLLRSVRRRLRWTWAIATAQWVAPAVAGGALGLVLLGRARPWVWPEPAALALAVTVLAGVGLVAVVVRIPPLVAARAADRGLATGDAFATALEFADTAGVLHDRVRSRAAGLASGVAPRDAVPLPVRRRRLAAVGAVAVAALALAWSPNPQDDVRRQQAAERAALDAEAERLRETADGLAETAGAGDAEAAAAEELRGLAETLDDAGSLDEGLEALAEAQADLAAGVPPDLLSRKAAVTGLERSLASRPLPGTAGGSAAEQFDELAAGLSGLSPEDRAALSERLAGLAETQAVGAPETAEALDDAAAALAAGDLAGARAALGEAAAAQADSAGAVAAGEAQAAAAAVAADTAGRLRDGTGSGDGSGGDGQGEGSAQGGEGEGSGQGSGEGESQGSGEGQGQGQGQGSGGSGQGGQGGGSPSGNVGGAAGGQGAGQGGQGRPGDNPFGSGDGQESGTQEQEGASVYLPDATDGDQLVAGGTGSGEPGVTVGRTNAPTGSGGTRVPLSELPRSYRDAMVAALQRTDLPPALRSVIRAYFETTAGFDAPGDT